jgi:hypothetical protein
MDDPSRRSLIAGTVTLLAINEIGQPGEAEAGVAPRESTIPTKFRDGIPVDPAKQETLYPNTSMEFPEPVTAMCPVGENKVAIATGSRVYFIKVR